MLAQHHSLPRYRELQSSMGKPWRDGKGKQSSQSQSHSPYAVQYWQGAWKGRQGKSQSTAPWKEQQEEGRWQWKAATNSGSQPTTFPRYDRQDPQMVVIAEKKTEEPSIVQVMQKAVSTARKAEAKRRKLQEELDSKRRCWTGFQQELKATFLKEQQRFQADVCKLQEEIKEAKMQEALSKQQLMAQGDGGMNDIFPGMDCDMDVDKAPANAGNQGRSSSLGADNTPHGLRGAVRNGKGLSTLQKEEHILSSLPGSPGVMEDAELQSLLQAHARCGHQAVGSATVDQPGLQTTKHTQFGLVQRDAADAESTGKLIADTKGAIGAPLAQQDPYQSAGHSPSAPAYNKAPQEHAAVLPGAALRGTPWQPSTPPVIRRTPGSKDSSGRKSIKQVNKTPVQTCVAKGPSLADKLAMRRSQAEQPQFPAAVAGVGASTPPTCSAETAKYLREMRPVDLPQQFLIYDDEDSEGDISDADPEFLEWAAKQTAGTSDLQEME